MAKNYSNYWNIRTERRIKKMTKVDSNGCWIWQGYIRKDVGYGQSKLRGKPTGAHRVSYTFFKGDIPDGLCVLHVCDVRACVNPDHLFLGTLAENCYDRVSKGRTAKGSEQGSSKLHDKDIIEIRKLSKNLSHAKIAERYPVARQTISKILSGDLWSWL